MSLWSLLFNRRPQPAPLAPQAPAVISQWPKLYGVPLRYLLGVNGPWNGVEGELIMHNYDTFRPAQKGLSAKYVNLWSEKGELKRYAPYKQQDETGRKYSEFPPVYPGEGFWLNFRDQMRSCVDGFNWIETDNRDSYPTEASAAVFDAALNSYGKRILLKNPSNFDLVLFQHSAVDGVIIENGGIEPERAHKLRLQAGKPDLAIYYVAFNDDEAGQEWANNMADIIARAKLKNIGVTYDRSRKEYSTFTDILRPVT